MDICASIGLLTSGLGNMPLSLLFLWLRVGGREDGIVDGSIYKLAYR
jgi:hypothetical protein